MKTILTALFLTCCCFAKVSAQYHPSENQLATIQTVVEGYNTQDYKKMKQPWGLLGKLLVRKKRLNEQFGPYFDKYGKGKLKTVHCSSKYTCTALLKMEKDPYKRFFLRFIYNDNARLQGFGRGYPVFAYPEYKHDAPLALTEKQTIIDSFVTKIFSKDTVQGFNGCLLVKDGPETVYKNCVGWADYQTRVPLADSTRFLLASCSKQFTAMAIMQLVERGKLSYTDNVKKYIPGLPYENMTIEHLLHHTSGLPDYLPLFKKHWDRSKIADNYDIVKMLAKHKPDARFQPGQRFDYSNTGYTLLSMVIEQISGITYGEFMSKNIFAPLGMHQTVVVARRKQPQPVANYAYGYVFSKERQQYVLPDSLPNYNYVSYLDGITGDDGVSSSINDLEKWHHGLNEYKLVGKKTMQRAYTPARLNSGEVVSYGYGFFLSNGEGIEPMVYHTGGWPGYVTMVMRFLEKDQLVVVLSNNYFTPALQLADEAAAITLR